MFLGLGLLVIILLILPIFAGIIFAVICLGLPSLRFMAAYSALIPMSGILGLIGGIIEGGHLAQPYAYRYEYGLSQASWPMWALPLVGMVAGAFVGASVGALSAFGINRLGRRVALPPTSNRQTLVR
jgi:hypothetical protein